MSVDSNIFAHVSRNKIHYTIVTILFMIFAVFVMMNDCFDVGSANNDSDGDKPLPDMEKREEEMVSFSRAYGGKEDIFDEIIRVEVGGDVDRGMRTATFSELDLASFIDIGSGLQMDKASARFLDDLIRAGIGVKDERVHEFLNMADKDGVVGNVDDALESPERALFELETARLRAEHGFNHAAKKWAARTGIEGASFGEVWVTGKERPLQDLGDLYQLSVAVQEEYSGVLVCDVARLYEVIALLPKGGERGVYKPDLKPVMQVFRNIEDEVLREEAAAWIARYSHGTGLTTEDIDDLSSIEFTRTDAEKGVLEFLVNKSIAMNEFERATILSEAYLSVIEDSCPKDEEWCNIQKDDAGQVLERIGYISGRAPATWQQSIFNAVWGCHLGGASYLPGEETVGEAVWSGYWEWEHWDPPTVTSDCLMNAAILGPESADIFRIQVVITGYSAHTIRSLLR